MAKKFLFDTKEKLSDSANLTVMSNGIFMTISSSDHKIHNASHCILNEAAGWLNTGDWIPFDTVQKTSDSTSSFHYRLTLIRKAYMIFIAK